jgi:hypothetical protein
LYPFCEMQHRQRTGRLLKYLVIITITDKESPCQDFLFRAPENSGNHGAQNPQQSSCHLSPNVLII